MDGVRVDERVPKERRAAQVRKRWSSARVRAT